MSSQYISEIRIFPFDFAPRGWAACNGQQLLIQQNQALFALLGTTYGGNGVQTFGLPDLRSRLPLSMGQHPSGYNYVEGQVGGEPSHTLLMSEIPPHTHQLNVSNAPGTLSDPTGNVFAAHRGGYSDAASGFMTSSAIGYTGGNVPHENTPPFLALNVCIALVGIFPSRN